VTLHTRVETPISNGKWLRVLGLIVDVKVSMAAAENTITNKALFLQQSFSFARFHKHVLISYSFWTPMVCIEMQSSIYATNMYFSQCIKILTTQALII
jgi:hypothetical protein